MKKSLLLNAPLSHIVAMMGHTDGLCIADAGLPIPVHGPKRIDLAVSPSVPSFLDVLDAVLTELVVEQADLAEEIKHHNPEIHSAVLNRLSGINITYIPHTEFKKAACSVRTVVRTGECTPFANIILYSGTAF